MTPVVCPYCSSRSTHVVDSRLTEPGDAVRRRRECEGCDARFTTYERVEGPAVTVLKRDGRRERFDRQKLLRGLERAANKRPVGEDDLEDLAESIAGAVRRGGPEARAEDIGELAVRGLARLDPVSGIQFAAVYRNFADLDELEAEVRRIKGATAVPSGLDRNMGRSPTGQAATSTQRRRSNARQP